MSSTLEASVFMGKEYSENLRSNENTGNSLTKLTFFKNSPQYRTLDTIDGEPMEFEWNIFTGFTALQLINKAQEFMSKMSDPSQFKERCNVNATLVSIFARKNPSRTLVIPRTWIRNKVVFYFQRKTTRRMGQRR